MIMKKVTGIITTVVLLIVFAAFAWNSFHAIRARQENAPQSPATQTAMQFLIVKEGTGVRTIPALATLKSRATIKVMPETSGQIILLNKREGDHVNAGDVIARISNDELQTQLRGAGAQANTVAKQATAAEETIRALSSQQPALVMNQKFWKAEHERDQNLFKVGALSKAQWEATANKLAEAQGKLAALDAQINASRAQKQAVVSQKDGAEQNVALWKVRNRYAEVMAPVAGVISSRMQEEGNYVTPNSVLYQLEDTSGVRLSMQIPQQYIREVKVGQEISSGDAWSMPFPEFTVSRIFPVGNELRQRTVEAESSHPLINPEFERQLFLGITIASASGVIVPSDGFFQATKMEKDLPEIGLYLVEGSRAVRKTLIPLLITDAGEAVIDTHELPTGSKLIRLGFMQYARMPDSMMLEEGGMK